MDHTDYRKDDRKAEDDASLYDAAYYKKHCGADYRRNNGWEEVFGYQASCLIKQLDVHTVMDVGCAFGYLVESFRDRGVDAEGIDISDYALSCVREDMRPYCRKQSILEPIGKKYDLVTCIEVLEHLRPEEIAPAMDHICEAGDMVLFSSTPFDYAEETHFSVHSVDYWCEQFAYRGFYHDVRFDAGFTSVQAMLFKKGTKSTIDLIRDYEPVLFQKIQENFALRRQLNLSSLDARTYEEQIAGLKASLSENEEIRKSLQEREEYNQKLLAEREESCSRELSELKEAHSRELSELKETHSRELSELKEAHSRELSELKEAHSRELSEMIEECDGNLLKMKEDHSRELAEMENDCSRKLLEAEKKHARKVLETQEECGERISENEKTLRQIYTAEVEKRRYYEDQYWFRQKDHEELEFHRILTTQMQQTLKLKITPGTKAMSIRKFLSEKLKCMRESRRLLKYGMDHWEPVFDPDYYAKNNPDVCRQYGYDRKKLLKHFICYGMVEARQGNEAFNVYVYIQSNPDIVEQLKENIREYYIHYIREGHKDGRRAI